MASAGVAAGCAALACLAGMLFAILLSKAVFPRGVRWLLGQAWSRQLGRALGSAARPQESTGVHEAVGARQGVGIGSADVFASVGMRAAKVVAAGLCGVSAAVATILVCRGGGALGGALSIDAAGIAALFLWVGFHVALLMAALCDLGARLIPREASAAVAACGAMMQAFACGVGALAAGALFGAVCVALCMAANRAGRMFGRGEGIGGGDIACMAALSLASGASACAGCLLSFLAAVAFSLIGWGAGKMNGASTLPMAPFFYAWFLVASAGVLSSCAL